MDNKDQALRDSLALQWDTSPDEFTADQETTYLDDAEARRDYH